MQKLNGIAFLNFRGSFLKKFGQKMLTNNKVTARYMNLYLLNSPTQFDSKLSLSDTITDLFVIFFAQNFSFRVSWTQYNEIIKTKKLNTQVDFSHF